MAEQSCCAFSVISVGFVWEYFFAVVYWLFFVWKKEKQIYMALEISEIFTVVYIGSDIHTRLY